MPTITMIQLDADALKQLQYLSGLRNEDVAEHLGVSRSTWAEWKASGRVPMRSLDRLSVLLGFEIPAVMPDDLPQPTQNTLVDLQEKINLLVEEVTGLRAVLEQRGMIGIDPFQKKGKVA